MAYSYDLLNRVEQEEHFAAGDYGVDPLGRLQTVTQTRRNGSVVSEVTTATAPRAVGASGR